MAKLKKAKHMGILKSIRSSIGTSQQALADELGLARTTIVLAEKDDSKPWLMHAYIGLGCLQLSGGRAMQLAGDRFAGLRNSIGLSASELAGKWGYAESTICAWERTAPPLWAHAAMVGLAVSRIS